MRPTRSGRRWSRSTLRAKLQFRPGMPGSPPRRRRPKRTSCSCPRGPGPNERGVSREYRHTRRVQFYETDAAGIVHFSWFFRYMEEAEHALWRGAGLSIAPPGAEIGWPRVAASFDYHHALRFEQEFDVWLRIAAITRRTIRYACVLTRGDTKIATGSL